MPTQPRPPQGETLEEMAARYRQELMRLRDRQAPPMPAAPAGTAPARALQEDPASPPAVPLAGQEGEAIPLPAALPAMAPAPREEVPPTPAPQQPPAQPMQRQSVGYLTVSAVTANGAMPVVGAHVTVSQPGEDGRLQLVALAQTDENGKSPRFELMVPATSYSEQPGTERPYGEYVVQVDYPGYFTMVYEKVPVFAGVNSLQQANLRPVPEGTDPKQVVVLIEREPNL